MSYVVNDKMQHTGRIIIIVIIVSIIIIILFYFMDELWSQLTFFLVISMLDFPFLSPIPISFALHSNHLAQ